MGIQDSCIIYNEACLMFTGLYGEKDHCENVYAYKSSLFR